jgi:hypothetical protein
MFGEDLSVERRDASGRILVVVGKHSSIADIPESLLVERVMGSPRMRGHVLDCHGFPERPIWRLAIPMDGLPGRRGDVDILVWNPEKPEEALAFEVKRFKAILEGDEADEISKLHEFAKGVKQANRLANIGFSLVYLLVFVLVDSRPQNAAAIEAGKHVYDGMNAELHSKLYSSLTTQHLNPRAGVMAIDYVQSMDDVPLLGVGTSGVHLMKGGKSVAQPDAVTEWVRTRGLRMPDPRRSE